MKKLLLITIVLFISACQPAPAVATIEATKEIVATATTEISPTEAVPTFPEARTGKGKAVEPGIYQLPSWYDIPLTIQVPDGWRFIHLQKETVFALVKGENSLGDVNSWFGFLPIYDDDAVSFFEDFKSSPGLQQIGEAMDVTLAGLYPATQLDMLALPNPDYAGDPAAGILPGTQILHVLIQYTTPEDENDFYWTTMTPEDRIRIFKVQLGDRTAILYIEAPQADFDQFLMDVDAILGTMQPKL